MSCSGCQGDHKRREQERKEILGVVPENFGGAIGEAMADLGLMIACVSGPSSKVGANWDVHMAYQWVRIGCISMVGTLTLIGSTLLKATSNSITFVSSLAG